jgi:hypothetical protein
MKTLAKGLLLLIGILVVFCFAGGLLLLATCIAKVLVIVYGG